MSSEIVVSFDTTGSMYPCLTQVRRNVEDTVRKLFADIPNLRIGVIAHGDYCDGGDWRSELGLNSNEEAVCNFIRTAPRTGGGDSPEAYEAVINAARKFYWTDGANKAFVLIGDDIPHPVGYHTPCYHDSAVNTYAWQTEARHLHEDRDVTIYSIQCLGNKYATRFYEDLAQIGGGYKLNLNQFSIITDLLKAICYKQANQLPKFEEELQNRGTVIDISLLQNLDVLSGRKKRTSKKSALAPYAVHPARFQVLAVDNNTAIKEFVEDNGLTFKKGRGFYEFTKPVLVQEYKEVIAQDKDTGEMFSGEKAREILGIPVAERAKVKPASLNKYRGFIQSTSVNRKLLKGTCFLYEVPELADR
jgi:hypothetical protein